MRMSERVSSLASGVAASAKSVIVCDWVNEATLESALITRKVYYKIAPLSTVCYVRGEFSNLSEMFLCNVIKTSYTFMDFD